MDREIKFRAKCCYSSDWVYGNLIHSEKFAGCPNEWRIHNPEYGLESDVIPETVGQYIGLRDKNGNDIYEGDIVNGNNFHGSIDGVIVFMDEIASFGVSYNKRVTPCAISNSNCLREGRFDSTVIGNIYDNPELIKQLI